MDCFPFLQSILSAKCLIGAESTSVSDAHICQKASPAVHTQGRLMTSDFFLKSSSTLVHSWIQLIGLMYGTCLSIHSPLRHKANHDRQCQGTVQLGSGARLPQCESQFSFLLVVWHQLLPFSKAELPHHYKRDDRSKLMYPALMLWDEILRPT